MEAIETVQRKATKLVPDIRNADYSQHCKNIETAIYAVLSKTWGHNTGLQDCKGVSEMLFKFSDASDDMHQTISYN